MARAVAAGTYIGTDEIGFPMVGAGCGTGEGGLVVIGGNGFTGLEGLGGTTGGGISLVWGFPTLMLMVVLALAGMVGTIVVVETGA